MPENELGELARHMGHELSVHRRYYRLQEDVTELAKVSKLLLLVDGGKAHQFARRNLDDIQINGTKNRLSLQCRYLFWSSLGHVSAR